MSRLRSARSRALMLFTTGVALVGVALASLAPMQATASSHREAPLISGQPQYDNTDLYAFVSPDRPDTTTLIANWIPFEEPAGGPNFYKFATDARYDINIDTDGQGGADLTYRWTFRDHYRDPGTFLYNTGPVTSLDDPDLNFRQSYDLQLVRRHNGVFHSATTLLSAAPVAPSQVGQASMPDYAKLRAEAVRSLPAGGKVFAGQADDPFFLDLRVFDLLYGGNLSEVGNDTLKGYNVNTVALQVPSRLLRSSAGQPVIGVWTTTARRSALGGYRQVSRLGMPLVNEVVIPLKDKDRFNASAPWKDAQFGRYVTNPELPKLIEAVYGVKAPAEPRDDLVRVFLTGVPGLNQPPAVRPAEMLRLNTAIQPSATPKRLGVLDGDSAGFPNGRRLSDDVVDIALQVVEGELAGSKNDLGDAVDSNDKAFGPAFPYVALPHSGSAAPGATAMRGAVTSRGAAGHSGVTQLNADNAASRASADRAGSADRPPPPLLAAAIAAGVLLMASGVVLLARRRGSSLA